METVHIPSYPVRVPIDPRIRQRRVEVRRNEGRRRRRVLLVVIALAVLSIAGWGATRSPLLDVDAVEVEGAIHTPAEVVRQVARLGRGAAMVDIHEAAAVERVEALPWVAEAQVLRRWPGTVSITVTERSALAVTVDSGGTWWLLDRSGRVLEQASARPAELIAVEGLSELPAPGRTAAGVEDALTASAALSRPLAAKVDSVIVVDGGGVDLRLRSQGGTAPLVHLGTLDDLDQKLRAVESVLASVDTRGLATLDVRLPAGPVLTRQ